MGAVRKKLENLGATNGFNNMSSDDVAKLRLELAKEMAAEEAAKDAARKQREAEDAARRRQEAEEARKKREHEGTTIDDPDDDGKGYVSPHSDNDIPLPPHVIPLVQQLDGLINYRDLLIDKLRKENAAMYVELARRMGPEITRLPTMLGLVDGP
jgi:hypothetical protein